MKKIVINGQFLNRRVTGQERFAYEIILELDKFVDKSNIELIVPKSVTNLPCLKNIKIIRYGNVKSHLWEQTNFAFYAISRRALSLNLCSVVPLIKPGIVCIHDLSYKVNPQYFKTRYAVISKWWHKIHYWAAWLFSPIIYTVSEYSKKQMTEIYKIDPDRIQVLANGWQHFKRINFDDSIFSKVRQVEKGNYFFTLGSLAPNKNIEWILKSAKINPNYQFVIAGKASREAYGKDYSEIDLPNVIFTGYIEDGQLKSLMRECKAFIFPSRFEGFGIPPLEAMSVGAKVIISNVSCLPEIYGESAYYIDPDNADINLDELLSKEVTGSEDILKKYDFARSADIIWNNLKKYLNK